MISKGKTHILIIAQDFPPDMNGSATRAYNATNGLILNGCKVSVIAAFPHYPSGNVPKKYRWKPLMVEYEDSIKIIRTFIAPLASKGLFRRLILFASFLISSLFALPLVGKIDIVWAASPNILSILPGTFYSFVGKCPLALNVDDLWPEELHNLDLVREGSLASKIAEFIAKFAYTKSNIITPISPDYTNVIMMKYRINPEKIHVIRAGVDANIFKAGYERLKRNEGFKVLYIGAFSIAYDFDQVLLAAKNLENMDGIEFVLQGGGELASHLKLRVRELGLNNLKIVDKIVSREEVSTLLAEADALILPLKDFGKPYLGISSKIYEYQATGKPIICCAEGQPANYVKETNSGIVLKPGNYKSLAEAVLLLKERPEYANKLGENGRRSVENKLTIEAVGLRLKGVFEAPVLDDRL